MNPGADIDGTAKDHPETAPAEPVDLDGLLDRLAAKLVRHLVLPPGAPDAIALWILNAHCHDVCRISPVLALVSPDRRCGKTTALNLISSLVPRAVTTANISPAALYRVIEQRSPTLLIDEADTFLKQSRTLLGILNAGHVRESAYVTRVSGSASDGIHDFSVWCPKVLAMIGKLPPTLEDRSIVIRLSRKTPNERTERLRLDGDSELLDLREAAAKWAAANSHFIKDPDPDIPVQLNDRAADNWRQLLAIADLAGETWSLRARSAAIAMTGIEHDEALGDLLLFDIKLIFSVRGVDRLRSTDLVSQLAEMEHRQWPEWWNGQPMTAVQLAKMLSAYGVRPDTHRFGGFTAKGYLLAQFGDAFARYT
jgi:putative DNA primase/helicase